MAKRKWMAAAVHPSRVGLFTEKAKKAGFGTAGAFAAHVMAHEDKYDTTTIREASFAKRGAAISRRHARRKARRRR